MANQLLAGRSDKRVGKHWTRRFVQRRPKLKMRLVRTKDYKRAICEDPKIYSQWFILVQNIIAKYGIVENDIYNFDETGFMMGTIFSGMVVTTSDGRGRAQLVQPGNREWATIIQAVSATGWILLPFIILAAQYHQVSWYQPYELPSIWRIRLTDNGWTNNEAGFDFIKHFNQYTLNRTQGRYRLLILDGYESHHSTEFELYYKTHNIITFYMLTHSSYKLQPLDIGCFGPLKIAYGQQIEWLIRARVNHIIKTNFLCFPRGFLYIYDREEYKEWLGRVCPCPLQPRQSDIYIRYPVTDTYTTWPRLRIIAIIAMDF
jgi:hypothetical protein